MHSRRRFAALALILALTFTLAGASRATPEQFESIRTYIKNTWPKLTRSNAQLAVAAVDPKFKPSADGRWPVYVSSLENLDAVRTKLKSEMPAADFAKVSLQRLPADLSKLHQHGLLYLPHPYVVPGGRFNEMYGWDSYFIQVGLVRDGEWALAKNMADNFIYEIRNYGRILNANRTYYLTRSQPPFLTQMLLAVYEHTHDKQWLAAAMPEVESCYRFWTTEPHLTPSTGLSRYYDLGDGPAPESVSSERDEQGRTHYDLIKEYYKTHPVADYEVGEFYNRATDQLTELFYKGDRSMRESGFDPSNRFGPFSVDIIHYNPVCLNSLLYLMERQTAQILEILGRKSEMAAWQTRAAERRDRMNRLMWNEEDGLYYDYQLMRKAVRHYPFLTTFYPLWAGIATPHQAERVMRNLEKFERPGGLRTSTVQSGNQWDSPFGWAPLQMIAAEGLRQNGFAPAADRISQKFLSLVLKDFLARGTIVEKYDVIRRASDVSSAIGFGYRTNVEGFGWTNGVFLQLYAEMSEQAKPGVLNLDPAAAAAAGAR